MKNLIGCFLLGLLFVCVQSCEKDSGSNVKIGGDPSAMSAVGTTVSSASAAIAGVSNLTASVVSVADGVSTYSGSGVVTNTTIKNIISSFPGVAVNGNNVSVTGFQYKQTTEGIESYFELGPGIIVDYSSSVGATYPVGDTGRTRTVVSKSTDDDYFYRGLNIKVMKVEEPIPATKSTNGLGVTKVTYWANHKFGLVGVQYDFVDGTTAKFPVNCSTTN